MQDPKRDDEVNHIRRNRGKHFRLWQKGKAAGMLSICCAMLLLVLAVAVPSADAAASSEPSGQSVTAEKHRKTDAMPWNGNRRIQPVSDGKLRFRYFWGNTDCGLRAAFGDHTSGCQGHHGFGGALYADQYADRNDSRRNSRQEGPAGR